MKVRFAGMVAIEPSSGTGHELGMAAESALAVAEDAVTALECRDGAADCIDPSGELGSHDRYSWPSEPREEPRDEGLGRPIAAVGPVHRGRMDPDQHLVPPRDRLFCLPDPNDVGWAVPCVNRCPHERRLASGAAGRIRRRPADLPG
jgi:hypothetical protein